MIYDLNLKSTSFIIVSLKRIGWAQIDPWPSDSTPVLTQYIHYKLLTHIDRFYWVPSTWPFHSATIKPSSTFMYLPSFHLTVWHQRLKCWNLWECLWLSVSPGTLHGNLLKSCLAESEEGTSMDLPFFWSHLQLQPCSPAVSYFLLTLCFMNLNIKTIGHSRARFIISGLWSFLSKCIQCMSEVEYLERFDELAALDSIY